MASTKGKAKQNLKKKIQKLRKKKENALNGDISDIFSKAGDDQEEEEQKEDQQKTDKANKQKYVRKNSDLNSNA